VVDDGFDGMRSAVVMATRSGAETSHHPPASL